LQFSSAARQYRKPSLFPGAEKHAGSGSFLGVLLYWHEQEKQMIQAVLKSLLQHSDLSSDLADTIRYSGDDPVYQTPFRMAVAAGASLGAVGLMLADIRQHQRGVRSTVEIDARVAAASMRSSRYILVDGKPGRNPPDSVTGPYPAADGRWNYFHCNFPHHQAALLRVLGAPADRAQVAAATAKWNFIELETAVDVAGGCAPAIRTPEEWQALPNTMAMAREPLVDIQKIGDSAPIPFPQGERPLSGLRSLDLTRVLAGPTCGRLLGEYGADVLKITCEKHPDSASNETDTAYGKRKAILDIRDQDGHTQFEALLRECDVFCQAYRRDAMIGLGFSAEEVAKIRPGIIYTSLCAFGFTGPWRGRRGFDTVIQSASGMVQLQGRPDAPQLTPVSALDYLSGYLMAYGTLVALKRRALVGGSYAVNVSLARVREWLFGLGMVPQDQVNAASADLSDSELNPMMTEIPSPIGRLKRFRPVIKFSDGAFSELLPWNTFNVPRATWNPR